MIIKDIKDITHMIPEIIVAFTAILYNLGYFFLLNAHASLIVIFFTSFLSIIVLVHLAI